MQAATTKGHRMRFRLTMILTLWAGLAAAQDTDLRPLKTGEDSRGWQAVGRLDIDRNGFCSAALISETTILTAAHCVYTEEGRRIPASSFTFLAGLRDDRAMATRAVVRVTPHPGYVHHGDRAQDETVAVDLAILELERPVRLPSLAPYGIGATPRRDAEVAVVSYARDRANAASLQKTCHVLDRARSMLMLSCAADFGASGAPVFGTDGGVPRIVAVMSAKGSAAGGPISLAVATEGTLDAVLVAHRIGSNEPPPLAATFQPRFTSSGTRNDTGAKFVRP